MLSTRTIKAAIAIAAVSMALTACSSKSDEIAEQTNREVAASKSIADPAAALAKLDAQLKVGRDELQRDCDFGCGDLSHAILKLLDERNARIKQAVDKLTADMLTKYYEDSDAYSLQDTLAPRILAAAEASRGASGDRSLLRITGDIVREGKYVIRNSDKATEWYARAWLAGDKQAAANNAAIYESVHDLNNAYLWALRCMGVCRADNGSGMYRVVDPDSLRSRLSAAAIRQAEQAATDTTVLALAGR
ncbi:hypothetical protein ACPCHQ_22195 [Ralstonia thomasii]|uniref:hypothetical protein n=1 Tax=Ralstonia thomasii TaxID=3058596 RepID=UPI003C2B2053